MCNFFFSITTPPTMPSISPPIIPQNESQPAGSPTTDQVRFLLHLLTAFDSSGPYPTKVQARVQLPLDLKKAGLPLTISTTQTVDQLYRQTIKLGNRLVFFSPGRRLSDCAKGNGRALHNFIEKLKIIIQKTVKVVNSHTNSDSSAQLEFLRKSLKTVDGIKIRQSERSVSLCIYDNKALLAEAANQREAATEMVAMLRRLANSQKEDSLSPNIYPPKASISISPPISLPKTTSSLSSPRITTDQHLVNCWSTVSHLPFREFIRQLDILVEKFPETFILSQTKLPMGGESPVVRLPNGAVFNCTHKPYGDLKSPKAVVAYKLTNYRQNLQNNAPNGKDHQKQTIPVQIPGLELKNEATLLPKCNSPIESLSSSSSQSPVPKILTETSSTTAPPIIDDQHYANCWSTVSHLPPGKYIEKLDYLVRQFPGTFRLSNDVLANGEESPVVRLPDGPLFACKESDCDLLAPYNDFSNRKNVVAFKVICFLINKELKVKSRKQQSISPPPLPTSTANLSITTEQHLVQCWSTVSHLPFREFIRQLDTLVETFPETFTFTQTKLPSGEESPVVRLPNGALFNCTHKPYGDLNSRKAVLAYKLTNYLDNLQNKAPKDHLKQTFPVQLSGSVVTETTGLQTETTFVPKCNSPIESQSSSSSQSPVPKINPESHSPAAPPIIDDQFYVDCWRTVSHLPARQYIPKLNSLVQQFPETFRLTNDVLPNGEESPIVRLPDGSFFVCKEAPYNDFTCRKDVVAYKVICFLKNKEMKVKNRKQELTSLVSTSGSITNGKPPVKEATPSNGQTKIKEVFDYLFCKAKTQVDSEEKGIPIPELPEQFPVETTSPKSEPALSLTPEWFTKLISSSSKPVILQPFPEKLQKRIQLLADYRSFASADATDLSILQEIKSKGETKFEQITELYLGKYRTTLHMLGIHQIYAVAPDKEQSEVKANQEMAKFIRDIVNLVDDFTVAYRSTGESQSHGELLVNLASQHSGSFTIVQSNPRPDQFGAAVNINGMVTFNTMASSREKAEVEVYSKTVQYLKQLAGLTSDDAQVGVKENEEVKLVEAPSLKSEMSGSTEAYSKPSSQPPAHPPTYQTFYFSEEKLAKRRQLLVDYAKFATKDRTDVEILSKMMAHGVTKITLSTELKNGFTKGSIKIGDIHLLEVIAKSDEEARAQVQQKAANYISSVAQLVKRFKGMQLLDLAATRSTPAGELVDALAKEQPDLVRIFRKTPQTNHFSTVVDLPGLAAFIGRPMTNRVTSEASTFSGVVDYLQKLAQFEVKTLPVANQPNIPEQTLQSALNYQNTPQKVLLPSKYLLKEYDSKRIYDAVVSLWASLPVENRSCKVLAAFVLTSDRPSDDVRVLSLGTGSKVISSEALQAKTGTVVHDSHAEVIARRALLCLLYEHLTELLDNGLQDRPALILEYAPKGNGSTFRLKAHLKLHLYVTSPPCGAAFQVLDDNLHFKEEGNSWFQKANETITSNRCDIEEGRAMSTFMTCSDKIAMWNVVGVQGALLSRFLEPIYLNSVLVSDLKYFKYETFTQAFFGRIDRTLLTTYLGEQSGFRLNEHFVGFYRAKDHEECFDLTLQTHGSQNSVFSLQSYNWYCPLGQTMPSMAVEMINSLRGSLFSTEGKPSRLAKCHLAERYQRLIGHKQFTSLSMTSEDASVIARYGKNRGTYANLKEQSVAYQAAKMALVRSMAESGQGSWIHAYGGVQDMFPVK